MSDIPFLDLRSLNQRYRDELIEAARNVVDSGWYVRGEEVRRFEAEFASYCGARHCVGVANGLDALALALRAWREMGRLKENDEVIVPSNTFIASVLAVTENRLHPVLVDPDEFTHNLSPSIIRKAIGRRTRVIMAVHLYGQAVNLPEIAEVAESKGILILEDAAQAHGAMVAGRRVGSLGHAAGFSFYPGKNLGALGDGGAVTSNDEELVHTIRAIANYGSVVKYRHDYRGVNSRLDELQAAFLRIKLRHLDEDNAKRRMIAVTYAANIVNPLVTNPIPPGAISSAIDNHVFHLYVVRTKQRDRFRQFLYEHGIETLVHYPTAIHQQRAFGPVSAVRALPVAELLASQILSLPISPVMSLDDAARVVSVVNQYR